MKTKRIIKVAMVLSSVSFVGFAQDTLELRTGTKILSKVMEISTTEIKYKKVENVDGPTYSEDLDNVASIKYKNGSEDVFPVVKPWLKPVKNKKEEPEQTRFIISQPIFRKTKIEKQGRYFMLDNKMYSENRILNEMRTKNDPEINMHVKKSKRARAFQPVCFAGIPLAVVGFGSILLNGMSNSPRKNDVGVPCVVLSAACLTTSFIINDYHKKQTAIAVELYNEKY